MQQLADALDQLEPWQLTEAARLVVQRLDDRQLLEHRIWCGEEEPKRREMEKAKAEAQAEVVAAVTEQLAQDNAELAPPAEPTTTARPWLPWHPLKPETHFYYGDHTTHAGKEWVSQVDPTRKQPNVWEPVAPGIDARYWVETQTEQTEQTETGSAEDGTRERPFTWRAGLVLKKDQYITFEGKVYRLAQDHTSADHWRPGPGLESIYTPIN